MKKIFISYSHHDETTLNRLHTHLAVMRREGHISNWFDREILAGGKIDHIISEELKSSDIFLALVSPDFLASNYCYEKEMMMAIELQNQGSLQIVPMIVEPCDWQATSLVQFKAVPKDGKAIAEWANVNNAYLDVIKEIRRIVNYEQSPKETSPKMLTSKTSVGNRYRVKRTFDAVDRADFRQSAYKVIKEYFQTSISEIDTLDDIRARFTEITAFSFTCTILNKVMSGAVGYLTVRADGTHRVLGDINYSYSENAPSNTSNGSLSVDSNEYELYLKTGLFFTGKGNEVVTPLQAAEALWNDLLERAGISTV